MGHVCGEVEWGLRQRPMFRIQRLVRFPQPLVIGVQIVHARYSHAADGETSSRRLTGHSAPQARQTHSSTIWSA